MRTLSGRIVTAALAALMAAGCTAARSGSSSLSAKLIRQGTPEVDLGGPEAADGEKAAPDEMLQQYVRTLREQTAATAKAATPATFAGTVESSDRRLAAALLFETAAPSAESHLRVAEEYYRLGILDAAHERLAQVLEKAPELAPAHDMTARIWREWGMVERAMGAAHRAVYFAPRSAAARNTLGTVLHLAGQLDGARKAFTRAFELDGTAAWALSNLCYLEFRQGRFDEARSNCELALRIAPNLAAARNNLALTHAAAGDLDRARQIFLAGADRAAAEFNMGILHLAARDYKAAADAFEQAIKVRPAFTEAKTRAHHARVRALTGGE